MDTRVDPRSAPYNENQPPMARTGIRRMLAIGLAAFVLIMGLVAINTRHEINEGPAQSAQMQSPPAAPRP
jgi:hypothetical protein